MKRIMKLFLGLSLLALILVLVGCGGGGGNGSGNGGGNTTPENSLSSDYFGLQVNYTRNYNGTVDDSESGFNNTPFTWTETVLEELEEIELGLYKTQVTVSAAGLSETFGDFIEKTEDGNYLDRGWWEVDEEQVYEFSNGVIIKNPVDPDFESSAYGKVHGQENVTVPAGTFSAWVFEDKSGDEINGESNTYYFVPYIGIVKQISKEIEGGTITNSFTRSLTSYYINSYGSSSASPGVGFTANSSTSLRLREIFKNKN